MFSKSKAGESLEALEFLVRQPGASQAWQPESSVLELSPWECWQVTGLRDAQVLHACREACVSVRS